MVNVYIKSYNRAYFLDRCLYSLYKYLSGDCQIIIWDDGTPTKYLDVLQEKYPHIKIVDTPFAAEKRAILELQAKNSEEIKINKIPVAFWREQIEAGSEIFLLWEDDIWLLAPISVNHVTEIMQQNAINQIKVRWWGNENTNVGSRRSLDNEIEFVKPKIHFLAETLVKNKYYLNSISNLLRLKKDTYFLQLYTHYEVGGVFFYKDYWLYLWPKDIDYIQEMIQLGLAAEWARKNKNTTFAKFKIESGRSTYLTSASGIMNEKDGFSMTVVNNILNETWFNNEFDTIENFPNNISVEKVYTILKLANQTNADPDKWKTWSISFQKHFKSIGSSELG